jgi:hypothetical protein
MSSSPARPAVRRALPLVAAALVLLASLGVAGTASATVTYSTDTPMILHNVIPEDLLANKNGVCTGHFTHVIRNVLGVSNATNYLNAAQRCGLKAILYFSQTVSGGTVYPSRVAPLVNAVKNHPALFGYLSVKEPSWVGITGAEIRSMYRAFKAADPNHPVVALFGDVPHFGMAVNPWTTGMANIVLLDWYPVETANGGRSLTGTSYVVGAPTFYNRIRGYVATTTPGTPIWLMVQTFKYLTPTYHKKQRPSQALLNRQVREGFVYLSAKGISFHTWTNTGYNIDQRRDPTMVSWMNTLAAQVQAGTFQ